MNSILTRLALFSFALSLAVPAYADRDLKEDTAATYIVGPFVDSTGAALTSLTIASIDITAYKNDGTAVTITPAASASNNDMVHVDDGYYSLELTVTDTSTPGYLRLTFQIATSLIFHEDFNILPANIFDSKYSTDKLEVDVLQFGGTNGTNSGGRPEVNVSHAAGTAWGSGAITAASIATDAIGAAETAADYLAEIKAQSVAALATDTYAEPGQATPGATVSLSTKIDYLYKAWRNRKTQTATAYSLYNDDATTVGQKATTSDDGTTTGVTEVTTGP